MNKIIFHKTSYKEVLLLVSLQNIFENILLQKHQSQQIYGDIILAIIFFLNLHLFALIRS